MIGSSVSNILFVLGLTALLAPTRINLGEQYIYVDLHYLVGAALMVVITMYDGTATLAECLLGLVAYGVYLAYLIKSGQPEIQTCQLTNPIPSPWVSIGVLIGAGLAIFVSAKLTVGSLSAIADGLGVSKAIISVTLLSIGTTLPECVVSVTAARAGKAEFAVGNVLGSCIFNGLAIPGIAACFGRLIIPTELINFPLPAYAAVIVFFYLVSQDKKISHYEGALLLVLYTLFVGKISGVL